MNTVETQKLKRKIIVSLIILLFVLLILMIVLLSMLENKKNNDNEASGDLKTVEDVINYYKCRFISLEESEDVNYSFDVRLEFCKPLYDGDISNEEFYISLIEDVARVINYQSFRLIDEKNEIKIEVVCLGGKIDNIIINGIEDYIIYTDSQISLKKYKEIPVKQFNIEAPILTEAINTSWNKDINFGTRDSIYNQYNIYFDEGIKVRNIDSRIYNIIFTKHYQGTVINGITPGTALEIIKETLGEPSFEDEELEVIGYKGDSFYIFFTKNEVSVYRLGKSDVDDFLKLADEFLTDKIDFLEMMNQLTYIWPDYSEYNYEADKVFISYPLKGMDIKINYDNTTGIILYNNFNAPLARTKAYLENTEFMGMLSLDNVFEAEKRRITNDNEEQEGLKAYKEENILPGYVSAIYDCYPVLEEDMYITKLRFISKNNDRPNRELNDSIDGFLWLNDVYIAFSKKNKGIYLYDLNVGIVKEILTGEADYTLKSFENGILKFDDSEMQIQF